MSTDPTSGPAGTLRRSTTQGGGHRAFTHVLANGLPRGLGGASQELMLFLGESDRYHLPAGIAGRWATPSSCHVNDNIVYAKILHPEIYTYTINRS